MKPIKFRAWDGDHKEMYEWKQYKSELVADDFESKILKLSQYTGKSDKNGVEVYFNDIVEDEYGHRYEVVFEGDCLRCNGVRRVRGGHKPKNRWFSKDLEIIGNRYEDKKLLEEQNK